MTMPYSGRLEQFLGQQYTRTREDEFQELTNTCPPVDPRLIAHLRKVFGPATKVKPNNPELGQLLFIQYGVDKVLDYLQGHYDNQSLAARKDHGR